MIADGAETLAQQLPLTGMGCDSLQGGRLGTLAAALAFAARH